jgi:hypothetical protein
VDAFVRASEAGAIDLGASDPSRATPDEMKKLTSE